MSQEWSGDEGVHRGASPRPTRFARGFKLTLLVDSRLLCLWIHASLAEFFPPSLAACSQAENGQNRNPIIF